MIEVFFGRLLGKLGFDIGKITVGHVRGGVDQDMGRPVAGFDRRRMGNDKAAVEARYAPLFKNLNLPADQIEKLKTLLADSRR